MKKARPEPSDPRDAFLAEAASLWPLAKGSLSRVRRRCARRDCRACACGDRHPAWIFVFREGGRQRCMYVSDDLAPELRRAVANGRRLERLLARAGAALVERHREQRRAGRGAR